MALLSQEKAIRSSSLPQDRPYACRRLALAANLGRYGVGHVSTSTNRCRPGRLDRRQRQVNEPAVMIPPGVQVPRADSPKAFIGSRVVWRRCRAISHRRRRITRIFAASGVMRSPQGGGRKSAIGSSDTTYPPPSSIRTGLPVHRVCSHATRACGPGLRRVSGDNQRERAGGGRGRRRMARSPPERSVRGYALHGRSSATTRTGARDVRRSGEPGCRA